jgi:preprotein translocase subunit SecA
MSDTTILRQIALGVYPQRDDEKPGFLERAGEKLFRAPIEPFSGSRLRLKAILPAVRREARKLADLPESELISEAIHLRYQLHQSGFERGLVARTFALVQAISRQKLGMAHYDTQMLGGWAILQGMVAEMETGEGKTLMATLPACTAALAGIPVHIITVNDYLATRDAQWMGPIYEAMGLTVGTVVAGMDADARRAAYACDVTYCTNKQVAFDYLRDRLQLRKYSGQLALKLANLGSDNQLGESLMLRGLCFAIIDEADSVLVDEAVTPLIISRPGDTGHKQEVFKEALTLARELDENTDYRVDLRERRIELTDQGCEHLQHLCEDFTGLWRNTRYREDLVIQALKAEILFQRDQHYLVREGKVDIVDEFTGRVMEDRSWEHGLHQMIEVKEDCEITGEQETLGRISYQRFFRRYLKLGGMTGTASELTAELKSVYRLRVMRIKPHKRVRRRGQLSTLLRSEQQKWARVVSRVEQLHKDGQPVLIGTRSVAASELLGQLLDDAGITNRVLNARQDADEAEIITAAGQRGQVTVATNMAGRGTDIKLDGDVLALGGLHVIATERHESARIDRQLYGRCGRQGDPGSYEAITSIEDELIIRYGSELGRGLINVIWAVAPLLAKPFALWLTHSAQQTAEKKNSSARSRVLRSEDYLENVLAFSGLQE